MTWGLLVLSVNVVYLVVSLVIGIIIGFVFKKWKIGIATFLIIALAPFWDLIIQKVVKTYYQTFKMEDKIYAYPEFDKDGKIESLDLTETYGSEPISYFTGHLNLKYKENNFKDIPISKFKMNNFMNETDFDDRIKNFMDIRIFDDNDIEKKIRIRFDDIKPQFMFIEKGDARYKIVSKPYEYLWGLYTINESLLIDTKTNKVLVQQRGVNFKTGNKDKFRNKYLLLKSANDMPFGISGVGSNGSIGKVLKINKL